MLAISTCKELWHNEMSARFQLQPFCRWFMESIGSKLLDQHQSVPMWGSYLRRMCILLVSSSMREKSSLIHSSLLDATATTFLWTLNGISYLNSTSNTLNISFPVIGTNTIGCQAQNLLSMKSNSTSILVQDIVSNLTLHAGNVTNVSTSQPLQVARFLLQMASGSNYACRVNYDTSQATTQIYFYTYGYIPGSYLTHQYLQPGAYNVSRHEI